jgi:hypothetical protein
MKSTPWRKKMWLFDVGSGIGEESSRGFPVMLDRRPGAIRLMDDCVAQAQDRVKTGLSATADDGFGLDATLSMRLMATMSLMVESMCQRLGEHLAGGVFVHLGRAKVEVFRHSW